MSKKEITIPEIIEELVEKRKIIRRYLRRNKAQEIFGFDPKKGFLKLVEQRQLTEVVGTSCLEEENDCVTVLILSVAFPGEFKNPGMSLLLLDYFNSIFVSKKYDGIGDNYSTISKEENDYRIIVALLKLLYDDPYATQFE